MIISLGIIAAFLVLCYFTIFVYFATFPTFGEALFSSNKIFHKLLGLCLWGIVIAGWYLLLSKLSLG